jgi:hypothetical protein
MIEEGVKCNWRFEYFIDGMYGLVNFSAVAESGDTEEDIFPIVKERIIQSKNLDCKVILLRKICSCNVGECSDENHDCENYIPTSDEKMKECYQMWKDKNPRLFKNILDIPEEMRQGWMVI